MPVAPARHDVYDPDFAERRASPAVLRGLRVVLCGLASFALTFVELVAELAGPLLLLTGVLWWLGLQALGALRLEPEIQQFLAYMPHRLSAAGYEFTPASMIGQGLALLAVVAACRTLNGIIAREGGPRG
ncbi:hypothetical protein ACFOD4_21350 [Pseudoroseomonas globiformis]|uniref:Uncharacterized protein n=1 Tax=Teichococcus globiformis TaxID=2307229 RepID=A0ABV7G4I0_9PROT